MKARLAQRLAIFLLLLSAGCAVTGEEVTREIERFASLGFSEDVAGGSPFFLWVECQGKNHTLDSRDKVDELVAEAKRMGIGNLLVQVYRSGMAWYHAEKVGRAPAVTGDYDPLAYVIKRASAEGITVHAWVNVFNLARNPDAQILKELGDEVLTRDNFGRSIAAYGNGIEPPYYDGERGMPLPNPDPYILGTEGLWLDPGVPAVRKFQLAVIEEIATKYEGLSGIHLDFIRYPYPLPLRPISSISSGLDFGYAPGAIEAFEKETGKSPPLANENTQSGPEWDHWRRAQVSAFVRDAREVTAARELALSVAALAWADRAYLSAYQDWRGWLEEGLLDAVIPMNYTRDVSFARYISRSTVAAAKAAPEGGAAAIVGLGAYLFPDGESRLIQQLSDARKVGADGAAFFSYDNIIMNRDLHNLLLPEGEQYR